MLWQPGHIILIATPFPGHRCMDDLTTEGSFDSLAKRVIAVFCLYVTLGCLYNQALADVRSIGARMKCLYSISGFSTLMN